MAELGLRTVAVALGHEGPAHDAVAVDEQGGRVGDVGPVVAPAAVADPDLVEESALRLREEGDAALQALPRITWAESRAVA